MLKERMQMYVGKVSFFRKRVFYNSAPSYKPSLWNLNLLFISREQNGQKIDKII